MWYVTVAMLEVVLVRTSEMTVTFVTCGLVNPVTEPTGLQEAVHVKSPPVTSEPKVTLKSVAEQIGKGVALVR